MRAPDPAVRTYWFSGGDLLAWHPECGAEPIGLQIAEHLRDFHLRETLDWARAGQPAPLDYHALRWAELDTAIKAKRRWARAGLPIPQEV